MGLPLTPEILRAAYDFLRTTPPFRAWSLPPGSEVKFAVSDLVTREGDCDKVKGRIVVRIARRISHTDSLIFVMAHEMIHVYEFQLKIRSEHGRLFRRRAARICKIHGWDVGTF